MTGYDIYSALGNANDALVESTAPGQARKKKRISAGGAIVRIAAAAAVLCLVFCGAFSLYKLGYLTASCGSTPGTIVGGVYYYHREHSGICSYTPGGSSTLLVSDLFRDDNGFAVNSYGVYYTGSGRLLVRVHETGRTETVYTASGEWTNITILQLTDETVALRLYNRNAEITSAYLFDCRSGETLKTLSEQAPYADYTGRLEYVVGDRRITLLQRTGAGISETTLLGNGVSLFDSGTTVSVGNSICSADYAGGSLIVSCHETTGDETTRYYSLVCPDGSIKKVYDVDELMGGTDDYLFYVNNYNEASRTYTLCAYEISSGNRSVLISGYDKYELVTDGTFLFTCAPWSRSTDCYRLIYKGGALTGVELITPDIG